jgi:hypothetical protein
MQRPALSLALATMALAVPVRASAYCRTTTARVPAGYDPTASGCINVGTALAWPSMPVTYQIEQESSNQVALATATSAFDRAFGKWATALCAASDAGSYAPTDHPALSFVNLGPTDAGYAPCEAGPCGYTAQAAPHVIIFRDQAWPYNDPANTIALTTVTFGVDDGHIFAADMEINSFEHPISTELPPPANTFSLEAIATHEAGHFVGLAHSQVDSAIMFAFYQPSAVNLTNDDTAAICAAYPPEKPANGGCSCNQAGEQRGDAPWVAFLPAVLATSSRRRRRRPRAARLC